MTKEPIFQFLSRTDRLHIAQSFFAALFATSLGIVFSLFLGLSLMLPLGFGAFLFFLLLFLKNPFLFLLCILPFRMMLDYFGEFLSVRITDDFFLSLSQLIGLQIFAIGCIFFLFNGRTKKLFQTFAPFWIFFAWGCASLFISIASYETARDLLRIFDILALGSMAFAFTKTREDFKKILVAVLVSSFVPLLFGTWQWMTGNTFTKDLFVDLSRIYGTFGHPNVFGMYLFSIIVLAFLFYRVFADTTRERIFAGTVGLISLILIFPTLSRVAWAMLLVFFLIVAGVRFRKMFFPVILTGAILFFGFPSIQERITDIFQLSADSSVLWRINIWKDGVQQVIYGNRFWWGFGLDTFPTVITNLHTQEFGSADTHNDPIKFFVEGGVIGFFVYVFWMGWFFVRLVFKFLLAKKNRQDTELYFLLWVFFLCICMASLSDAVFKSTPLQWILWIVIGSFFGYEQLKKKNG